MAKIKIPSAQKKATTARPATDERTPSAEAPTAEAVTGPATEVGPTTEAVPELLPAVDTVPDGAPVTEAVTVPATVPATEVGPTTEAVTETLPGIDTVPEGAATTETVLATEVVTQVDGTPTTDASTERVPALDGVSATRDERLPAIGTKLEKRDRHGEVRCTCEVVAEGILYAGKTFKSLSGAAMAAATDLGLKNKTQNGYVFWGLSKPPRPETEPEEMLQKAWAKYHERAKAVVEATPEGNRTQLRQELEKQAEAMGELARRVA